MPLAQSRNDIGAILYPASGTYNYRIISGTGRLSAHSYGIAIDLKVILGIIGNGPHLKKVDPDY